jgi:hypothetical protein
VTRLLGSKPRLVERLTRGYLAVLAICDVSIETPFDIEQQLMRLDSTVRDYSMGSRMHS